MTELEQLKIQIDILRAQRNGALDEAVNARTQAQLAIKAMMVKDQDLEQLRQRVRDLETENETPAPGSKAHLNELAKKPTFNGA